MSKKECADLIKFVYQSGIKDDRVSVTTADIDGVPVVVVNYDFTTNYLVNPNDEVFSSEDPEAIFDLIRVKRAQLGASVIRAVAEQFGLGSMLIESLYVKPEEVK